MPATPVGVVPARSLRLFTLGVAMTTKYLFPCSCGKAVPIDIRQAGQTVVCACGQTLDVPTMLAIRQLEAVRQPEAAPTKTWNLTQGVMFATGTAVAIVSAVIVIYLLATTSTYDGSVREARAEYARKLLDDPTPEESWNHWLILRSNPLFRDENLLRHRLALAESRRTSLIAAIVGVAGMAIAAASFLVGRGRHPVVK